MFRMKIICNEVIFHILSQEFLKMSCLEGYILTQLGGMEHTSLTHIIGSVQPVLFVSGRGLEQPGLVEVIPARGMSSKFLPAQTVQWFCNSMVLCRTGESSCWGWCGTGLGKYLGLCFPPCWVSGGPWCECSHWGEAGSGTLTLLYLQAWCRDQSFSGVSVLGEMAMCYRPICNVTMEKSVVLST